MLQGVVLSIVFMLTPQKRPAISAKIGGVNG